jgi:hypothetical protein
VVKRLLVAVFVVVLASACGPDEGPDLSRFAAANHAPEASKTAAVGQDAAVSQEAPPAAGR